MNKESAHHGKKSGIARKPTQHNLGQDGIALAESVLPAGSWQRTAAGVAAAAGGGLLAVAMIGVGPAAIAGAAGYLAYRGMKEQRKDGNGHRH